MRGLILALAALGLILAAAAPAAEAHEERCVEAEPKCMVRCTVGHLEGDPLADHECRPILYP